MSSSSNTTESRSERVVFCLDSLSVSRVTSQSSWFDKMGSLIGDHYDKLVLETKTRMSTYARLWSAVWKCLESDLFMMDMEEEYSKFSILHPTGLTSIYAFDDFSIDKRKKLLLNGHPVLEDNFGNPIVYSNAWMNMVFRLQEAHASVYNSQEEFSRVLELL